MSLLRIEKEGPVAVMIWQHAPQNQFNNPFMKEVIRSLKELETDDTVRAVVITSGVEKFFSTGLFLEWLFAEAPKDPEVTPTFLKLINELMIQLTGFPKPVVGAINGHAAAMGCIITASMDYRFMTAERGFVRLPEVAINVPFWPGMHALFKDIVSPQTWRAMTYTDDKFTAQQAMDMGFIDRVYPEAELRSAAVAWAEKLGSYETATFAAIKRGNRQWALSVMKNEDPKTIEAALARMAAGKGLF